MSDGGKLHEPSGTAWLLPVAVDPTILENWEEGPAPFNLSEQVRTSMGGHLQNPKADRIDAQERRHSWTSRSADLLVPTNDDDSPRDTRRWYREASGIQLGSFALSQLELLTAPAAGAADDRADIGVLIIHLAADQQLTPDQQLRDALYGYVRQAEPRKAVLKHLMKILGPGFDLEALPGAREQVPSLYAVTNATSLDAADDDELLLAREMATLTPSQKHGSESVQDRESRLARTRSDMTRLSDSWSAMVTGHGTAFVGSTKSFPAAATYISTIYVDAMAGVLLSRTILSVLADEIHTTIGNLRRAGSTEEVLRTTLHLRTRLLWLRSTLLRIPQTESRPTMLISERLALNLRVPDLLAGIEDDIASLMEVASLQHQLAQEEHRRIQEEHQRQQEASSKRVDTMLAILTVVALPLTMAYSGIDLLGGGNKSANPWYWIFSVLAAALALGFIWRTHRKRR
ncbi:hypothetical protein FA951_02620 [Dermacoccus nishinomiyaensis]|uniref:hypothetical protein n=1 Tax=Dermacoccus TaxID=57495 RepID=UPI000A6096AA|nr:MULTISPECIES: hypothetical protein [Dermacoccus]MBO1758601.1 hypothetical protein [Dermacoccus sp. NHGro5]TJZ98081.1 hypothetical protein FA951_02620 [Dermacoccus nishinomiyaensis]